MIIICMMIIAVLSTSRAIQQVVDPDGTFRDFSQTEIEKTSSAATTLETTTPMELETQQQPSEPLVPRVVAAELSWLPRQLSSNDPRHHRSAEDVVSAPPPGVLTGHEKLIRTSTTSSPQQQRQSVPPLMQRLGADFRRSLLPAWAELRRQISLSFGVSSSTSSLLQVEQKLHNTAKTLKIVAIVIAGLVLLWFFFTWCLYCWMTRGSSSHDDDEADESHADSRRAIGLH